jgi:hypothetical protein
LKSLSLRGFSEFEHSGDDLLAEFRKRHRADKEAVLAFQPRPYVTDFGRAERLFK